MSIPLDTVKAFAPIIHFHKDEQYLPCSIEHILKNGALKDWSPTPIWHQTSVVPAMIAFRDKLWMIYSEPHSSQLWVTRSSDGLEFEDAVEIQGQGTTVPGLATFNDRLWMAYARADSEIVVTSSADGLTWTAPHTIGQQTTATPALATFNNQLWMTYRDAHGTDIWVTSSADGNDWSRNFHKIGQQTRYYPALAVFRGQLWMAYSDQGSAEIWITSSADGNDWSKNFHKIGQQTGVPAMAAFKGELWMAYTGEHSSEIYVTSSADGNDWKWYRQIGQQTSVPALATLNDQLCMTYTGATNSQLWATVSDDGLVWHRPDIPNPTQQAMLNNSSTRTYVDINPSQYPGEGLTAPMYYAVQEFADHKEITYLILCAFNGPQTVYVNAFDLKCTLADYARHPGDIERVTVRLEQGPDGLVMSGMTVEAHGVSTWIDRANIQFQDRHPLVYSSLNAHGTYNYKDQNTWVIEDRVPLIAEFGDALDTNGDPGGSAKIWVPSEYRLVGLDGNGNPIGDQLWAKFRGRIGGHVENGLRDGRHFDGRGLSSTEWTFINGVDWIGKSSGLISSKLRSGDGPVGLGQRSYIGPGSSSRR
ncbi:Vps62-related protein [Sorangium sp. So ce388]|uniref:Vps62-related protein n=1 Tax=Sorangium sp. So ce388 TaxID=3133309 RepID=UPI003F5AF939